MTVYFFSLLLLSFKIDIDDIFFIIIGCFKRPDLEGFVIGNCDGMLVDWVVYVRFGKYFFRLKSIDIGISMLVLLLLLLCLDYLCFYGDNANNLAL